MCLCASHYLLLLFLCMALCQISNSKKTGQRIFPVGMMGKALAHIKHIE